MAKDNLLRLKLQDGIIQNDRRLAKAEAVERYFQMYFDGLHRYAFTILKNNDDAKDAVQAVFVKLWEKRDMIDEKQSVQSYLYTSIYHHCLNVKRHEKVRKEYVQRHQTEPYAHHNLPERKENLQKINTALESLPEQCRLIFYKSRFEKKKYAEIAAEMNLSVKTIEAQIGKALRILREKLLDAPLLFIILLTLINK